jgi:hypothetical protein
MQTYQFKFFSYSSIEHDESKGNIRLSKCIVLSSQCRLTCVFHGLGNVQNCLDNVSSGVSGVSPVVSSHSEQHVISFEKRFAYTIF